MITKAFTGSGLGGALSLAPGESAAYSAAGEFTGFVFLEESTSPLTGWKAVAGGTADTEFSGLATNDTNGRKWYRFRAADTDGDTAFTGTAVATLSEGKSVAGGAPNGSTVSARELGEGLIRKTVLTLAATPVSVVSVGAGRGVGGTKIYGFPKGRILVLGTMATLEVLVAAAKQADFTDATPEGDIGIGSVAPADNDALGTDATDDDMATSTPFTMDAYAAEAQIPSEAYLQFDGTITPVDVLVNVAVDAADIDNDITTQVLVSGTVTLYWMNLGEF